MKKIFVALVVLACTLGVYGQQRSVFMEFGGSFQKTNSISDISGSTITKKPAIIARLGYAVSTHSLLGLTYRWNGDNTSSESILVNDYFIKTSRSDIKHTFNTYGLFYRYYFMPVGEKRWNVFADFNPGYFREQQDRETFSQTDSHDPAYLYGSLSEASSTARWSGLDVDLGAGFSCRLVQGLSVQLSLRSIANVKHFKDSKLAGENNERTFIEVFDQPLSNTYLSFTYQF